MGFLGNVIMVSALFCSAISGASSNKLTKLYHHTNSDAQSRNVEVGSLVFYFEKDPVIRTVSDQKGGSLVFELPNITADASDIIHMIEQINASKAPLYTVSIERLAKPNAGLRVVMRFNPEVIGVSFEKFPTIRMEKGLIVHMHNKGLLKQINATMQKPVINVASVVIDCGHGGSDTGAIGCGAIKEKDVSLPIGLQVAQLLEKNGVHTVLTRAQDSTVSLAQRTTLANSAHADAFVSIHANSSGSAQTSGIETFCVNPKDFVFQTATLTTEEKKSANSFFLSKCAKARQLADLLHSNLLAQLANNKFPYLDRKVKHGSSQVLLGAQMPAVLVEVGFVTNAEEAQRLQQKKYQLALAQGISNGILAFLRLKNA